MLALTTLYMLSALDVPCDFIKSQYVDHQCCTNPRDIVAVDGVESLIEMHYFTGTSGHKTFYRATGPATGPLMIFMHGWPDSSIIYESQLLHFGRLGYRAIAPDLRGYGRSSIYNETSAYAAENCVNDMLEFLHEGLGGSEAIWVGHDWGTVPMWGVVSKHPEVARAAVGLTVPYGFAGLTDWLISTVDRSIYNATTSPLGQWDYQRFYETNFQDTVDEMDNAMPWILRFMFGPGNPALVGTPALTSLISAFGGWIPAANLAVAPAYGLPTPITDETWPQIDSNSILSYRQYYEMAFYLKKNGFFSANAWYLNSAANEAYFAEPSGAPVPTIAKPTLFIHALLDQVLPTKQTPATMERARTYITDLTEKELSTNHWITLEDSDGVNDHITDFLTAKALLPTV